MLGMFGCKREPGKYVYPVKVGDRFGVINETGRVVSDPIYDVASHNSAEEMLLRRNGQWVYCCPGSVREVDAPKGDFEWVISLRDGLFWLGRRGKEGAMFDTKGRLKSPEGYAYSMYSYSEGMIVVQTGELYGFAGRDGKLLIAPRFHSVQPFSEGLAAVETSAGFGYIDTQGDFAISPTFANAADFSEGLAMVRTKSHKKLFIDKTGAEAVHLEAVEPLSRFSHGRARVRDLRTREVGYVDQSGRVVILPSYDLAGDFAEGLAWVRCYDGKGKYLDENGRTILSFEGVIKMQSFAGGAAFVETETEYGYVDRRGKWLWSRTGSFPSQREQRSTPPTDASGPPARK